MKLKNKKSFFTALGFLAAFVIWTALVKLVDVQAVGPEATEVGFATMNAYIHKLTGFNKWLYDITDVLGLVPFAFAAGFGIFGLVQWIRRKSLWKVDRDIIGLGVFYAAVVAVYLLFEVVVINYRPCMPEGVIEASYPSSTTMLVATVIPTAIMQFAARIKNGSARWIICILLSLFVGFMVGGRIISGVHWLSDIIGGALFSIGIVTIYYAVFSHLQKKTRQ